MGLSKAIEYAREKQERHRVELFEFLRFPSVSTQPAHDADVQQAAQWLAASCEQAGLENVRVIETERHPLVYADWLHAGPEAPTVLLYGHYDVQPPDPLEAWESNPFEPSVRDEFVFARGAADDKGQLFIHVKAVEAFLQGSGRLPVNVKLIAEGEEESGSESLTAYVPEQAALLAADAVLISDTAMVGPGIPTIVYGTRGICHILMDLYGPAHDLHSGSYGGGIDNPLNVLGHVLAGLRDMDGHISIPGFYDRVRPLGEAERELLRRYKLDEAAWLAQTGAPALWGEPGYDLLERITVRPTLDVNGIIGGYTGPGRKTVLPSHVHAKISMRLVPDQNPDEIRDLFVKHVQRLLPATVTANFSYRGGGRAMLTDIDAPPVQAAARAAEAVFGRPAVFVREGGTIPVLTLFQTHLQAPLVMMGFGLPGDRIHSPNERFYLPNFSAGITTVMHFFAEYATSVSAS